MELVELSHIAIRKVKSYNHFGKYFDISLQRLEQHIHTEYLFVKAQNGK